MIQNKKISPELWVPVDGFELEDAALQAIKLKESVLVVAGPGAGKTEMLAQKACYLLQTGLCKDPKRILAISFKRDAAKNLKERVNQRGIIGSDRFDSLTFDAFAKGVLDQFLRGIPDNYQPSRDYVVNDFKYASKILVENGYSNDQVRKVLDQTSQFSLEKEKPPSKVWEYLLLGDDSRKSALTFGMISRLAEFIILENPLVKKSLLLTYDYVFLDEFQDTTSIQYDLLKTCFLGSTANITAVGDTKQRIMLWAGARLSVFTDFMKDFSARCEYLLINHRSAPRLVELQKMMYSSLNEEPLKICCSSKWNPDDGVVRLLQFTDSKKEAEIVAGDILKKLEDGIASRDICILAKQKIDSYSLELSEELHSLGIKSRIDDEYQKLLCEPIVELLLSLITVLYVEDSDSWLIILNYWESAIGASSSTDNKIENKQLEFFEITETFKAKLNTCGDRNSLAKVLNDEGINYFGKSRLQSLYPTYQQDRIFYDVLTSFTDRLWESYEKNMNNWPQAVEDFIGLDSIPIMTIHKSKGLEYSIVYFLGLEDNAFWSFRKQPLEDRSAFFVALSRAKLEVCFTYCSWRESHIYKSQSRKTINEFYQLLNNSNIAEVISFD